MGWARQPQPHEGGTFLLRVSSQSARLVSPRIDGCPPYTTVPWLNRCYIATWQGWCSLQTSCYHQHGPNGRDHKAKPQSGPQKVGCGWNEGSLITIINWWQEAAGCQKITGTPRALPSNMRSKWLAALRITFFVIENLAKGLSAGSNCWQGYPNCQYLAVAWSFALIHVEYVICIGIIYVYTCVCARLYVQIVITIIFLIPLLHPCKSWLFNGSVDGIVYYSNHY